MIRWIVTLASSNERLSTVRAERYEEALGRAIVLAAGSGREPATAQSGASSLDGGVNVIKSKAETLRPGGVAP